MYLGCTQKDQYLCMLVPLKEKVEADLPFRACKYSSFSCHSIYIDILLNTKYLEQHRIQKYPGAKG